MIAVNAHYDGKAIIPDEPLKLQPGQRLIVRVSPVRDEIPSGSLLSWIVENAVDDPSLPTDMAAQHDHYLYGVPKREP